MSQKNPVQIQTGQWVMGGAAVVLLAIVFFSSGEKDQDSNRSDLIPMDEQCRESITVTAPSSSGDLSWSEPVRGIADCRFFWDMGLNAYRTTAIAVRANGNEIQFQGKMPDGTMEQVNFEHLNVETLEFAALREPVSIEVYWANNH